MNEIIPPEKIGKSKKGWIFSVILIVLIVGGGWYYFSDSNSEEQIIITTCGDDTVFGQCSVNVPYFCEEGQLIEKASVCGCPEILQQEGEICKSKYQTEPKQITLDYLVNGEKGQIDYLIYNGMINYIFELPTQIHYEGGAQPNRVDFKLRNINEVEQRELLIPLVINIQNLVHNKEEQARIAVSLVQNIPYKASDRKIILVGNEVDYSRYPYEILYEHQGICGEKSELLAFLLQEIGYEVVFFSHDSENHESIGVRCPSEYSLKGTGYCFIETTGPSIITDSGIEYIDGTMLFSDPEILPISKGISFTKDLYEYEDAIDLNKIRNGDFILFKNSRFEELKQKYGLAEEYYLA